MTQQIGAPGQLTQGPLYAFARDDIVLFVQTPDPKLAEEALAAIQYGCPGLLPYSSALTMNPASTSSVADVT